MTNISMSELPMDDRDHMTDRNPEPIKEVPEKKRPKSAYPKSRTAFRGPIKNLGKT